MLLHGPATGFHRGLDIIKNFGGVRRDVRGELLFFRNHASELPARRYKMIPL